MKWKHLWLAGFSLVGLLGAGGSYVLILGVPQLDPPKAELNTNLEFRVASFNSQAMGTSRKYGIVLPPGYSAKGSTRYPVVILLHGGHGDERDFEDKAKLTSVLHDLYAAKKLPPAIIVTPDGNDQRGTSGLWDSEYFDGKNGKVSSLIGKDLVQEIKARYRTSDRPEDWAMGGLSSGGWGALNIGLRHLDQFRIFFSHTGYFRDRSGPQNSPEKFVSELPPDLTAKIKVYLDAGKDDHKYLAATESFHRTLDRLNVSNEYNVFPGGHGIIGEDVGWNYWHKHLYDSLSFVGQHFQQR
jgi:enterochelin esterase-like enzyme